MVRWFHLLYEVIFLKKALYLVLSIVLLLMPMGTQTKASQTIKGAARVVTDSGNLNVRQGASTTSAVKDKLKKNTYVTLISQKNNFWYVRYDTSKYGYCHKNYLKAASTDVRVVKTTSGRLRVRSSASLSSTVKGYLSSGTEVTVLSTNTEFAKIVYNGNKIGYVSKKYVVKREDFTPEFSAISLKVPDYKQTDSRWSGVTLGSSGQTIGKIGCATTALAMTESYRTKTTIYPDAMSKRLSYTSGGAVYWPTNYNIVTSESGHLTKIYNALKSNKPVIVGAKNSYGGQHYVVVTGVKECSTLSASAFYINDPGSSSRLTLDQFYGKYPYFYKMLYAK